jgi:hypothetical protein
VVGFTFGQRFFFFNDKKEEVGAPSPSSLVTPSPPLEIFFFVVVVDAMGVSSLPPFWDYLLLVELPFLFFLMMHYYGN